MNGLPDFLCQKPTLPLNFQQFGGMNYLLPADFNAALPESDINTLGLGDPLLPLPAEQHALAEVRRELSGFDLGTALDAWQNYDVALSFPRGSRILLEGVTPFYAVQDAPAGTDPADPTYWVQGDNRQPELLEVVLRLTIFHLVGRMGSGAVPAYLADRARDARAWLQAQARGLSPALFPRLDDKPPFQYGSTPPRMDGRGIW